MTPTVHNFHPSPTLIFPAQTSLGDTDKRQGRELAAPHPQPGPCMAIIANPLMRACWLPRAGASEARGGAAQGGLPEAPGMPYTNSPLPPPQLLCPFVRLSETCANYRQSNVPLERMPFLKCHGPGDNTQSCDISNGRRAAAGCWEGAHGHLLGWEVNLTLPQFPRKPGKALPLLPSTG